MTRAAVERNLAGVEEVVVSGEVKIISLRTRIVKLNVYLIIFFQRLRIVVCWPE